MTFVKLVQWEKNINSFLIYSKITGRRKNSEVKTENISLLFYLKVHRGVKSLNLSIKERLLILTTVRVFD